MRARGSVARFLFVAGLALVGFLAVVGGLALPVAGLIGTGLVAATVGCLAGGNIRDLRPTDSRSAAAEAAVLGAGGTFAAVLAFAGVVVLVGGPVAVLVASVVVAATFAIAHRRTKTSARAARSRGAVPFQPVLRPVGSLSTEELSHEWLLSRSALAVLLDVGTRQAIVRRRQELLDELERRDPAGFARWLAGGPTPASTPGTAGPGDAADKDAA